MSWVKLANDVKSFKYGQTVEIPLSPPNSHMFRSQKIESMGPGITTFSLSQHNLRDAAKLAEWYASPKGVLFIGKQNLLSALSPRNSISESKTRSGVAYGGGRLREGIFTPVNSILQASVAGTGIRFEQKGITPFANITRYSDLSVEEINNTSFRRPFEFPYNGLNIPVESKDSRLVLRRSPKEGNIVIEDNLNLEINKFRTQLDSAKILNLKNDPKFSVLRRSNNEGNIILGDNLNPELDELRSQLLASNILSTPNIPQPSMYLSDNLNPELDIYKRTELLSPNILRSESILLDTETEAEGAKYKQQKPEEPPIFPLGDIGKINRLIHSDEDLKTKYKKSQQEGLSLYYNLTTEDKKSFRKYLDPIMFLEESSGLFDSPDYINFYIDYMDQENNKRLYLRAYLDPISDSYGADWATEKFSGRGEELFRYSGFNRSISLGFSVLVQSKIELQFAYQKLNKLASLIVPKYNNNFMQGNIIKLTIGNYINDLPGIVTGFSYNIDETNWDIYKGTQLPMLIKVNGFNFKPIHKFLPEMDWDNVRNFVNQ